MTAFELDPNDTGRHPWHADSAEQCLEQLASDAKEGLSDNETRRRQERFGSNDLPERKRATLPTIILRQFKDPLIYILLIAGAVSLLLGNYEDAVFIFIILVINTLIGTVLALGQYLRGDPLAEIFFLAEDGVVARVKGAAEALLPMCDAVDRNQVSEAVDALARDGYRVLALAAGPVNPDQAEQADPQALRGLRFLGLVGFIDPLREGVVEAVKKCHDAGVDVRMITGDHPTTGLAIARQLGIEEDPNQVITGQEIREIEGLALSLAVVVELYKRIRRSPNPFFLTA